MKERTYQLLLLTRKGGIQRQHPQLLDFVAERSRSLLKSFLDGFDILLTGQEDQNIARKRLADVDLKNGNNASFNVIIFRRCKIAIHYNVCEKLLSFDVETTTRNLCNYLLTRENTDNTGASSKNLENFSESMVAEEMMIFKSLLALLISLIKPRTISV